MIDNWQEKLEFQGKNRVEVVCLPCSSDISNPIKRELGGAPRRGRDEKGRCLA